MTEYSQYELSYRELLVDVNLWGRKKENRTGVDTIAAFNKCLTIDVSKYVPILTGRKIFWEKAYHEYVWIKDGLTTTKYLNDNGIKWWNSYANENGELGKTYGHQLRSFNGEIDQLDRVHRELRMNTRRAHCTFWNPSELEMTPLPPCYTGMTFMRLGTNLNLSVQLRSSDLMLGLPYDVLVMYFFLLEVAEFNELKPHQLGIQITDAHIYENHLEQMTKYNGRPFLKPPTITKLKKGGYKLNNYKHGEHIMFPLNT